MERMRTKLALGVGAILAVAGGGAAFAATRPAPAQESTAIIADAAAELGVDAAELKDALENALAKRVDAAVESGRLTQEQGAELKARIAAGEVPLVGLRGGGRHVHPEHRGRPTLDAAAAYLGLTEAELRTRLEAGDTLAEVATAEGKTLAGLVSALVAAQEAMLATAVADGRLTDAQRDRIVAGLEERVRERVNGTFRRFGHGHDGPGFGGGRHGGPPPPGAAA